jgi:hypothetical protein
VGLKRRIDLIKEFVQLLHTKYVTGFNAPGRPLLDPETLDWLTGQLKRTSFYLEFGCGGTTVLANDLGVLTVSVESDAVYAAVVRSALRHPELTKIVTPDMGITGLWGMPMFFANKKGPRYIKAPFNGICTQFPDLIFVDGRYRVACTLESASRAARAGFTSKLLFDDYQPRDQYHVVEKYLGAPERIGRAALFLVGAHEIPREVISEHAADPR